MKIVRDRGDARWLPSRFNLALFRLFAYLRLRSVRPQPRPGLILAVDRGQNAFENYAVCVVILGVVTLDFATLWNPFVALPAAVIALQLAILTSRPIVRVFLPPDSNTIHADSMLIMAGVLSASVYFAMDDSVAGYTSRGFLALGALNAIASAIMFLLRGRVAAAEARFT